MAGLQRPALKVYKVAKDIITCKTPEGRLRWSDLFEATVNEDSDDSTPYFRATVIFDSAAQASPDYSAMKTAAAQAAKQEWGEKLPHKFRSPFRPGSDKDVEKYPEFAGDVTFINVKSKKKPGLVAGYVDPQTGKLKVIEDDTEVFNGCYVRLSLTCYAYEVKGNAGVSFGLRNVQKVRDGDMFSAGVRAVDDFDVVDGASNPDQLFS